MIPSDFWSCLAHLGEALESPGNKRFDRDTLALLKAQFESLPFDRQCDLRREMQDVIIGLARLDACLSLESMPVARATG